MGHIAKAMRDTEEVDKNDWVTAVIDVPGARGVVDRLIELRLPVTPYKRW